VLVQNEFQSTIITPKGTMFCEFLATWHRLRFLAAEKHCLCNLPNCRCVHHV